MIRAAFCLVAGASLLAACGEAKRDAKAPAPIDPAVAEALADPLMTDPDLTMQNDTGAAIVIAGADSATLPPIDRDEAAVAAAREAAARLVGRTPPVAPDPASDDLRALRASVTAAQIAKASGLVRHDCAAKLVASARWAAVLPDPFRPYPRSAVETAAGADGPGCALRVVRVKTPVPLEDVLSFHAARLRTAGYAVRHGADGEDHVLRASKGGDGFLLYLRKGADGLTTADLVAAD
jgi:hypothetical protein